MQSHSQSMKLRDNIHSKSSETRIDRSRRSTLKSRDARALEAWNIAERARRNLSNPE